MPSLYSAAIAPFGGSLASSRTPPSSTFRSRVALGIPAVDSSRRPATSPSTRAKRRPKSAGYRAASMWPAPARKAASTGAVGSGRGDAGGGGRTSRNRWSHASAPRCPPRRVWSAGPEDMMSAMMEIRPFGGEKREDL